MSNVMDEIDAQGNPLVRWMESNKDVSLLVVGEGEIL
jgi:hypothetical protein